MDMLPSPPARTGRHRLAGLFLLGLLAGGTSGFSSCAGSVGPLLAPLTVTPSEVLLRASPASRTPAVGLARVGGGSSRDRYRAAVDYDRDDGWLAVEVSGPSLTLRADPAGLPPGTYFATVIVEADRSEAAGSLRVEFIVLP
jgi:hypothetical protein